MTHKDKIQHQVMKKMRPAFTALTEIRLIAEIKNSEVNVSGYSMIRYDVENKNTDVVLFIRDDIKYETVLARKLELNWCVGVLRSERNYIKVLAVLYSSSSFHGVFVRFLEDIVEENV